MNDHLLGKYRGCGLFYDENMDVFFSDLQDRYELSKEPTRKSLKELKKFIDVTIKANLNFKPFRAYISSIQWNETGERIPYELPKIINIIGIKKDGGLMVEKTKTQHFTQLNGDVRNQLFIKDEESEKLGGEIAIIEAEIETLRKKKENILRKYKPLDLSFIEDYIK